MIYNKIKEIADTDGTRRAVKDDNTELTYSQLIHGADCVSELLIQARTACQEHVICFLKTSAEAVVSILAVNRIGAIFVPLSTNLKEQAIANYIEIIKPKVIITSEQYLDKLSPFRDICTLVCIHFNENELNYSYVEASIEKTDTVDVSLEFVTSEQNIPNQSLDNVAEILFSSGTTGEPKGIMLTNGNVTVNVEDIIAYMGIQSHDVSLIVKPLVHSSTLNGEIITSLYAGASIVMCQKLITPRLIMNYIFKYRISVLFLIPTLLAKVIMFMEGKECNIDSIRLINFYGSTISEDLLKNCLEQFPKSEIIYSYGISEASPRVTYIRKKDIEKKMGSSGICLDHVKVTIRDDKGKIISKANVAGEIYVEGPNVMKGYYNNEALTKHVLTEYGLKTGDTGYLDEDGYLYVLGRMDDMIIKSGINIYPMEIENVISKCPIVSQVLVKRAEDFSGLGQKIQALIVLRDPEADQDTARKKIVAICNEYLETIKIPDEILFKEQLELTQTGKIKRK